MSNPLIHSTACVSASAQLHPSVRVGVRCVVEGTVRLGPGCVLHPDCHLIGPLDMGEGNEVHSYAVLGGHPQHLRYNQEPTNLHVGDYNVFGERTTVHRGTIQSGQTTIGHRNQLGAGSHVAHDCQIGNGCVLLGGALLGGHCQVDDGVVVGMQGGVHQFCRLGRFSSLAAHSITTKDVPPFVAQAQFNHVMGLNEDGMAAARLDAASRNALRRVFDVVFLARLSRPSALERLEQEMGDLPVVREFIEFVERSRRGINRVGPVDSRNSR